MKKIIIKTQKEFDELPKSFDELTFIEIRSLDLISIRENIKNSRYDLYGSSRADLYGSSRATLYGSSRADLYDSSRADLYDSSRATLYGSSRADLYGSSRAALYGSSRADLYDSSRATLYDSSRATLHGSSCATLHGSSRADLYGSSRADLYGSSRADLYGSSCATLYGSSRAALYDSSRADLYDSSRATLYDSSRADLYDSSRADLYGSSRAALYDSSRADLYDSSRADLFNDSFAFVYSENAKIKAFEKGNIILKNENKNIELFDEATVKDSIKKVNIDFDTWLSRGFVVADGIYRELVSQKEIDKYIVYETDKGFVARFENTFAHGETEQEAIFDLKFKLSDRNKDQFKDWKLDETKTKEELILAYRIITGACSQGVKDFIKSKQIPENMTIKQAIELTNGHYGHEEFKEFF